MKSVQIVIATVSLALISRYVLEHLWYLLGVNESLSYAKIDLPEGFNTTFVRGLKRNNGIRIMGILFLE